MFHVFKIQVIWIYFSQIFLIKSHFFHLSYTFSIYQIDCTYFCHRWLIDLLIRYLSMYYRWAVSCCRSWRSTLSAVLTPGCSVRGSTSTVSCPTPSPRPGHSRSCTCSAGPRPCCHRRCTAYLGESWTTKGNQLIVQHFVTCYVMFNRTYSIAFL